MLVDPDDLRFTQDSIALYFQHPYRDFSIRQAVRRISEHDMAADDFPLIRVISYNGCFWSIDNRRLWVFRYARCGTISVRLQEKMLPRLSAIISNPILLRIMQQADFFPNVRHRGQKDLDFDRLYPQPSSFQRSRNSQYTVINVADEDLEPDYFFGNLPKTRDPAWASNRLDAGRPWFQAEVNIFPNRTDKGHTNGDYTDRPGAESSLFQPWESHGYTINKAQEQPEKQDTTVTDVPFILSSSTAREQMDNKFTSDLPSTSRAEVNAHNRAMSVTASPQTPPISTAQAHGNNENTAGTTASPPSPSITPPEDRAQYWAWISRTRWTGFRNLIRRATTKITTLAGVGWNKCVKVVFNVFSLLKSRASLYILAAATKSRRYLPFLASFRTGPSKL